jgi:hypothetical protein
MEPFTKDPETIAQVMRAGVAAHPELKTELELCVCNPLGVGRSLNQDSQGEFRLQTSTLAR